MSRSGRNELARDRAATSRGNDRRVYACARPATTDPARGERVRRHRLCRNRVRRRLDARSRTSGPGPAQRPIRWVIGPPFGITLVLDGLSAFMLTMAAGVGIASILFSVRYITPENQRVYYHPLFHLLLAGVTGAFLTGDLFNLFVWFEVMLIVSYVFVAFYGTDYATAASFRYLVMNVFGSALMLVAIGGLYATTGTLNMADMARRLATPTRTVSIRARRRAVGAAARGVRAEIRARPLPVLGACCLHRRPDACHRDVRRRHQEGRHIRDHSPLLHGLRHRVGPVVDLLGDRRVTAGLSRPGVGSDGSGEHRRRRVRRRRSGPTRERVRVLASGRSASSRFPSPSPRRQPPRGRSAAWPLRLRSCLHSTRSRRDCSFSRWLPLRTRLRRIVCGISAASPPLAGTLGNRLRRSPLDDRPHR